MKRHLVMLGLIVVLGVSGIAAPAMGNAFTDDDGNMHERNIEAIAAEGITLGCAPGEYCPSSPVTRAEMAAFLLRAITAEIRIDHDSPAHLPPYRGYFSDVPEGQWFTPYVEHLREHEITRGCNPQGTLYCPADQVTREQMASFLVRAFGLPQTQNDYFTDDEGSLHEDDINALREAGVTLGCSPDGTLYCPRDAVLRDQMASFLARGVGLDPVDPSQTFRTGTWRVGPDIAPATYRNSDSSQICYWERLSGFGGTFEEIKANDLVSYRTVMTIKSEDAGFSSERCGIWSSVLRPITPAQDAPFSDGTYIVGFDIAPGTWRSEGPAADGYCYWERLSGFSGDFEEIIANDLSEGPATVRVDQNDAGFRTEGCGTWSRMGN